jgi:hypothetical protein
MPGDIPLKVGTEITQPIVLKMENLTKKIQKGLEVAFAEVVNQSEEVSPAEMLNWIQKVCKECLVDSSEGLCNNRISNTDTTERV